MEPVVYSPEKLRTYLRGIEWIRFKKHQKLRLADVTFYGKVGLHMNKPCFAIIAQKQFVIIKYLHMTDDGAGFSERFAWRKLRPIVPEFPKTPDDVQHGSYAISHVCAHDNVFLNGRLNVKPWDLIIPGSQSDGKYMRKEARHRRKLAKKVGRNNMEPLQA